MADSKVTALTELTSFSGDETFYVVEDDDGTPASRRMTIENLAAGLAARSELTGAFAPLAGPYVKDFARVAYSSGNITVNGTSWTNVQTALDLTLTAATGDVIEYTISGRLTAGSGTQNTYFDVATIVSGSPVNYFATAGGASDEGVQGWNCRSTTDTAISGSVTRTLVSGDVSGGTVTLRLRYRQEAAGNRSVVAGATNPVIVYAKNLGPA